MIDDPVKEGPLEQLNLYSEQDLVSSMLVDFLAIKGPMKSSLYDNLMKFTKERLEEIAEDLMLDVDYSLVKTAFVQQMVTEYLTEEFIVSVYINMSDLELLLIDTLIETDTYLEGHLKFLAIKFLVRMGLVQMYDYKAGLRYSMSDELKEAFKKLNRTQYDDLRKMQLMITDYTTASLNLYGAISYERLSEHFIQHMVDSHQRIPSEEVLDALFLGQLMAAHDFFIEDHVFMSSFFDDETLDVGFDIAFSEKPYYRPALSELMKYAARGYVDENESYKMMETFIINNFTTDPVKVENLLSDMLYNCEFGRLQDTVNGFAEEGIEFQSEEQINEFMALHQAFSNNMRMWANHGFTPLELRNTHTKTKKVGRNEPCPCGSGKKYKKCCGNHLSVVK